MKKIEAIIRKTKFEDVISLIQTLTGLSTTMYMELARAVRSAFTEAYSIQLMLSSV